MIIEDSLLVGRTWTFITPSWPVKYKIKQNQGKEKELILSLTQKKRIKKTGILLIKGFLQGKELTIGFDTIVIFSSPGDSVKNANFPRH